VVGGGLISWKNLKTGFFEMSISSKNLRNMKLKQKNETCTVCIRE